MDDEQKNETSSACSQCDEYLAGWKRARADYENAKKDAERERGEFVKYANERLLHDLLPAIDQFGLAMKHLPDTSLLPDDQRKPWENWLKGVRAVQSSWEQAVGVVGLERVPTDGAFDPSLHDAAGKETAEGVEAGTIVRVIQDGWRLHGKVLRPARVIVAE